MWVRYQGHLQLPLSTVVDLLKPIVELDPHSDWQLETLGLFPLIKGFR